MIPPPNQEIVYFPIQCVEDSGTKISRIFESIGIRNRSDQGGKYSGDDRGGGGGIISRVTTSAAMPSMVQKVEDESDAEGVRSST